MRRSFALKVGVKNAKEIMVLDGSCFLISRRSRKTVLAVGRSLLRERLLD